MFTTCTPLRWTSTVDHVKSTNAPQSFTQNTLGDSANETALLNTSPRLPLPRSLLANRLNKL